MIGPSSPLTFTGRHITWFLPKPWRWTDPDNFMWHDVGAEKNREGAYASGLPIGTMGIALPNHYGTLKGWFQVTFPDLKRIATIRHVDVGPDTGVIDLSAPLAFAMFKRPERMPDFSAWQAVYLGWHLPAGLTEGVAPLIPGDLT